MRPTDASPTDPPSAWPVPPERVTLAVEGWNDADLGPHGQFERALESLRDQTFPVARSEVLVVVAERAAATERLVERVLPGARILHLDGFTYYRCKNLALREATGDVVLFADSDVVYHPRWAERLLAAFRPGIEVVAGRTRYAPGFLSRTVDLCDGNMVLAADGYTPGFYAHNVALARSLFERFEFHEGMGQSGGGSVEALRPWLEREGIRPWFVASALAEHPLPPFVDKRLRVGSFHLHCRRVSPEIPGAALARVPLLAPFLVMGGVLAKTWWRVWRRRSELPGGALAVPGFLATTGFARAVELVGACACAWAPRLLQARRRWHEVPAGESTLARPSRAIGGADLD